MLSSCEEEVVPSTCFPRTPSNEFWEGTFSSLKRRILGVSYVRGHLTLVIPKVLPNKPTDDLCLVSMHYRGVLGRGERFRNVRAKYTPGQDSINGAEMLANIIPFNFSFMHSLRFFDLVRQGNTIVGKYMLSNDEGMTISYHDCGTFSLELMHQ
jgi:hypothetical protein